MHRWLAAIMALMIAADAACAQVTLDARTQAYLEGVWYVMSPHAKGARCGSNSNDYKEEYEFEFRRSGGTFRITDSVDADWRGSISTADRKGKVIRLVLDGSFKQVELVPRGPNRMDLRETIGSSTNGIFYPAIAYRCRKPNHSVTAAVSDRALRTLTNNYFAKACGVAPILSFELFGPTRYFVDDGTSWFDVLRAVEKKGVVTLTLRTERRTTIVPVTWLSSSRIRAGAWGEFNLCQSKVQ